MSPPLRPESPGPRVPAATRLEAVARWGGQHAVRMLFAAFAIVWLTLCLWLAYQLRFDFNVPPLGESALLSIAAMTVLTQLFALFCFHQFDGLLTYFSTPDLKRLVGACTGSSLLLGLFWLAGGLASAPPRSVILMDYVLCIVALSATRFVFRYGRGLAAASRPHSGRKPRRVGIVGAGDTGAALARDLAPQLRSGQDLRLRSGQDLRLRSGQAGEP